nr:hypothetical protein CFP56_63374 [Quercus suber]POE94782.1 hypothetical protein CFP56_17019 [Quercus suber]
MSNQATNASHCQGELGPDVAGSTTLLGLLGTNIDRCPTGSRGCARQSSRAQLAVSRIRSTGRAPGLKKLIHRRQSVVRCAQLYVRRINDTDCAGFGPAQLRRLGRRVSYPPLPSPARTARRSHRLRRLAPCRPSMAGLGFPLIRADSRSPSWGFVPSIQSSTKHKEHKKQDFIVRLHHREHHNPTSSIARQIKISFEATSSRHPVQTSTTRKLDRSTSIPPPIMPSNVSSLASSASSMSSNAQLIGLKSKLRLSSHNQYQAMDDRSPREKQLAKRQDRPNAQTLAALSLMK